MDRRLWTGLAAALVMGCAPSDGYSGFRIVRMEPSEVPLGGGRVLVHYEGAERPWKALIRVNKSPWMTAERLEHQSAVELWVPPSHEPAKISLSARFLYRPDRRNVEGEFSYLHDAGEWSPTAAEPVLDLYPWEGYTVDTLGVPLHPELARPCARARTYRLSNLGEQELQVSAVEIAGAEAFSAANCVGESLGLEGFCDVDVCFSSNVPGTHTAQLRLRTTAGDAIQELSSEVLPFTDGLDPAFGIAGGIGIDASPYVVEDAALGGPGVIAATWKRFLPAGGYGMLTVVSPGGAASEAVWTASDGLAGPGPSARSVHGDPNGNGYYAILQASDGFTSLARWEADGSLAFLRDVSFSPIGGFAIPTNGLTLLEVAPSGRIFVGSYLDAVAVFTSAGEPDLSYGTSGAAPVGAARTLAVDSTGRLYLGRYDDVVRVTAEGAVDASFTHAGGVTVLSIAPDDTVFGVSGSTVLQFAEDGSTAAVPLTPAVLEPISHLAIDAAGRFLVVAGGGGVRRYLANGTFDRILGFEGAKFALCPASGGCSIVGLTEAEPYVLRLP